MTQQENTAETFPLIPILVLFGGLVLLLVLVFGTGGSTQDTGGQAVAAVPTATQQAASPTAGATATPTPIQPRVTATAQVVAAAALDPQMVSAGESIFQAACAACHGFNARGIAGLGKTLIGSDFVDSITDDEFHDFLLVGRGIDDPLNTTGVMMPAKGGNPSLTDEDLYNVIAYIRSLNTGQGSLAAAAPTVAPPTESGPRPTATPFIPPAQLLFGDATAEATQEPVEVAAAPTLITAPNLPGQADYLRSCAGCHGVNGEGVPYLAAPLAESDLVQSRDGFGLFNFLTQKQPPVDPRTAFPHPYRGGYPLLTDEQIRAITTYLYALVVA